MISPFLLFDGTLVAAAQSTLCGALAAGALGLALFGRRAPEVNAPAPIVADEATLLREQLRLSEDRYRALWENTVAGFFHWNASGAFSDANPAFVRLMGFSSGADLVAQVPDFGRALWNDAAQYAQVVQSLRENRDVADLEASWKRADGAAMWVILSVRVARDENGAVRYDGRVEDISRQKVAEDRLMRHAFHDKVTGLPDRNLFLERLTQFVRRGQRQDAYQFAVLLLDIDRFKVVNDSLGHVVGDQLLSSTARKIEACLRPGDTLARLGGDEFGILLDDIHTLDTATQLADRILKRLALPSTINEQEVYSNASIGIALGKGDDRTENLLRDAESALYRAKEIGRARYEVFDPEVQQERKGNVLQLESELRRAVERNEFRLMYQPIVSLGTGRIIGFEALVRWVHPKRGYISPGVFIPVAEDTGLILPIGSWVLRTACKQLAAWQKTGRGGRNFSLMMSINLSAKQFAQPDLTKQIERVLQTNNLDGTSVKLEITESAIMGNPEAAIQMLLQLKAFGIKLSLDDFGTGYSSLSYLHRFPFNVLKIDQSFVGQMDSSDKNEEIVRTIVALAHNLNMDVIAEGVETEAQLEHLRALKCHFGQGYFFAGPMDPESAGEMLEAYPQW